MTLWRHHSSQVHGTGQAQRPGSYIFWFFLDNSEVAVDIIIPAILSLHKPPTPNQSTNTHRHKSHKFTILDWQHCFFYHKEISFERRFVWNLNMNTRTSSWPPSMKKKISLKRLLWIYFPLTQHRQQAAWLLNILFSVPAFQPWEDNVKVDWIDVTSIWHLQLTWHVGRDIVGEKHNGIFCAFTGFFFFSGAAKA